MIQSFHEVGKDDDEEVKVRRICMAIFNNWGTTLRLKNLGFFFTTIPWQFVILHFGNLVVKLFEFIHLIHMVFLESVYAPTDLCSMTFMLTLFLNLNIQYQHLITVF